MTSMPANAKQEQTERWVGLAAAIALPLIGGAVSSIPTHADTKPGGWYTKLRKPKWTPPNWVFSRVWNVAYIAQGVASWLVWKKRDLKEVRLPLYLYGAQLALNLIWQPIFFKFHKPIIATVDSAAVTAVATAATVTMARAAGNKAILPLMVPYLGWLVFSTTLYGVIAHQNPNELDPNNGTGAPSKKEKKAKKGKADTSPATASGAAGTGSSAAKGPTVTTSNPASGTTTSSTAK